MLASTFNTYLAIAAIFNSVSSAPVASVNKRNAALDAASAAQTATTLLVCQLSYQTKYAAFALGIGSAPVACVAGSSTAAPVAAVVPQVIAPVVAPVLAQVAPVEASTGTPLSVAVVAAAPVSIAVVASTVSHCSSSDPVVCAVQAEALLAHNTARALHHAPPLVWNDTLAEGAMRWAENAVWKHSGGSLFPFVYGENLYASTLPYPASTMTDAINAFTSEESAYDYNNPSFSEATGHFTQVVWKSTTQVGCVNVNVPLDIFLKYTSSSSFTVCEYAPAGII